MADIADVEIRIYDQEAKGYPVEITLNNEQEFEPGYLDPAMKPAVPSASPETDGEELFRWLFADPALYGAWVGLRQAAGQRRIRLRIDADAPELHQIPWELLREPGDGATPLDLAAARATPFSRYLAGRWQPGKAILERPIKILVAIANPGNLKSEYDLEPVHVSEEWASLQEALAGLDVELTLFPSQGQSFSMASSDGDDVRVSSPAKPCTLAGLATELQKGYHVLHFIGHGSYSTKSGRAALYLADEDGQVKITTDQDVAEMLARQLSGDDVRETNTLRLVFLAACQSATRSPADAFRGLGPQLIRAGVPAVLAMQGLVPVDTARQFAAAFYRDLLLQGCVDAACNEARSALLSAGLPGAGLPVLFSRLRSNRLLGQEGTITSTNKELFWPFLLDNIAMGKCIPILGPQVAGGLLPSREFIAQKLADRYQYPLADKENLIRVAQYIDINNPDALHLRYVQLLRRGLFTSLGLPYGEEEKSRFQNATFAETVEALDWREKVLVAQEDEIHHLLADLELPLYITTNFDNFMVEALKRKGLSPRRLGPRWQFDEAGSPNYVIEPITPEAPVVFQLNGFDGDPGQIQNLVLSEDDYLAHFVRISTEQDAILPMNLVEMLSECSFLFLGYKLGDWEFRIVLQALIKPIAQLSRSGKRHVGVQLEAEDAPDHQRAREYLGRYLGQYDIDIYWGSPQQFASELHGRWQSYLKEEDDWA